MKKIFFLFFLFGLLADWLFAGVKNVPADYPTIQAGINAAAHGDTVLASPGRYLENINFNGKKIIVSSLFLTTDDRSYILNTVIDGSNPAHPDTASCVLFINNEDSNSVLCGFTLENGKGTKWVDEHGAGTYTEGGAILAAYSSPTIKFNLIQNNEAINNTGTVSAGGGAIRCGDAAPKILNNVIINNKALYGGGIVLNYCSGSLVANNIIAYNEVLKAPGRLTFGGGGIWIQQINIDANDNSPNNFYNNTIVANAANDDPTTAYIGGGAILSAATNIVFSNNIVWGNTQATGNEFTNLGNLSQVINYNIIQQDIGNDNLNVNPEFDDSLFYLSSVSPAVDAGNPDLNFNDRNIGGIVLFPAKGTTRSDIGAYGGQYSSKLIQFLKHNTFLEVKPYQFDLTLPADIVELKIPLSNKGSVPLEISAIYFQSNGNNELSVLNITPLILKPFRSDSLKILWHPSLQALMVDTLLIAHNDPTIENPVKIEIMGSSIPTPVIYLNTVDANLGNIDVNTQYKDTLIYIYNRGTAPDTIQASINYFGLTPSNALVISPTDFQLAAGDSQAVKFTIYPPLINKMGLNVFQPALVINAKTSNGMPLLKKIRFRIVGTTDIIGENLPFRFNLEQNYPNPFNPSTTFKFELSQPGFTSITILDVLGVQVDILLIKELSAGNYSLTYDASHLAGGVYFYRLQSGRMGETRKFLLLK